MNKTRLAALAAMSALLVACGGSGGSDAPAPSPAPSPSPSPSAAPTPAPAPVPKAKPEGIWTGRASTGNDVNLLVLEDGTTWGIYTSPSRPGQLAGALAGNMSVNGNRVSGSGRDFQMTYPASVVSATFSGTFSARNHINLNLSNGSTFIGSYDSLYETPARLSDLAGSFVGLAYTSQGMGAGAATVQVSSNGAVRIPFEQGCGGYGTVRPRSTGKNVFDFQLTVQGNNCLLPNGTVVRGNAFYDRDNRELIAMALTNDRGDGFMYLGRK